jgi:hypothetical protein
MNVFNQAYTLFSEHVKGYDKIIASIRPHPGGKDKILAKVEGSPDEVWHGIQNAINYASSRYGNFTVRVMRGSQNDPGAMELPIDLIAPITSPNGAGIAGMGNAYGNQYPQAAPAPNIGEIERRFEKQFNEKLEAALKEKEQADTINGLVATVKELKRGGGGGVGYGISDFVEQTGFNLSDPESINAAVGGINNLIGTLAMFFKGMPAAAPAPVGISGTPNPSARQRAGRVIVQQESPANVPTEMPEPGTEDEPEEQSELFELTEQQELALQAVEIMEQAGFEDAGAVLRQVANWAASNPEQSRNYLQFLK